MMLSHMISDIFKEGYCGGLVFSWQDEWFKRTWNTMDLDLSDERPFWSNPQTCEQEFGLMAFEPGKISSVCNVDGDISEWKKIKPILSDSEKTLSVNSDEKYLYIMMKTKKFDFKKDSIIIPIDTIQKQGNYKVLKLPFKFSRQADFLITINGINDSRIQVDSYYDVFNYIYAKLLNMITSSPENIVKNSGVFNSINLCLSRSIILPEDNIIIPFQSYETGKLKYGNANPESKFFDSLTDFSVKNKNVEIRIPWQLLNVMDPSKGKIMDDFNSTGSIKAEDMSKFYFGAEVLKNNVPSSKLIPMSPYKWKTWILPEYHERLKASYYIMKDAFLKLK